MIKLRFVSHIVSSILLILLVVMVTLIVYHLVVQKPSVSKASSIAALKIEAVRVEDGKLKLYVRNIGERVETLSSVYVIGRDSVFVKTIDLSQIGIHLELWGGDVVKLG